MRTVVVAAALVFLSAFIAPWTMAHIDPVRISLSQLYLGADLAGIVRIESVQDRNFAGHGDDKDDKKIALREVLTAEVLHQYKGPPRERVDFFLDAHGPADYRPGDLAVLFAQEIGPQDPLYRISRLGSVDFVSHQARNSEHRLDGDEVADYQWVLDSYSKPSPATGDPAPPITRTLLYMLTSGSAGLAESALIDWQNLGAVVGFSESEVDELYALTRDPQQALNHRLAILKTLTAQKLLGAEAWDYLFQHESGDELQDVIRATRGHEHRHFTLYLTAALESDSPSLAGAAARALAHPTYAGVEPSLMPLLAADDLSLNYAAVAALTGIDSPTANTMLRQAADDHANPKVRRMIRARLQVQASG